MQDAGPKRTDFGHHCSKETVGEAATCPTGLLMSPTFYFIHYWTQSYANNVILLASNKLIFISPAISFWKIWIGNETNIIWVQGENHLLPFLSCQVTVHVRLDFKVLSLITQGCTILSLWSHCFPCHLFSVRHKVTGLKRSQKKSGGGKVSTFQPWSI